MHSLRNSQHGVVSRELLAGRLNGADKATAADDGRGTSSSGLSFAVPVNKSSFEIKIFY